MRIMQVDKSFQPFVSRQISTKQLPFLVNSGYSSLVEMSSYDDQNNENIYNLVQQEEVIAPKAPRYSEDGQYCHNWHYWPFIVNSTIFKTNRAELK